MTATDFIAQLDAPGIGNVIITDKETLLLARNLFEIIALRFHNGKTEKVKEKEILKEIKEELETSPSASPSKINGIREKEIMMILWQFPDSTCQNIAEDLNKKPAAIYNVLKNLEKDGFISAQVIKIEGEKTKGKKHYAVTEEGRIQFEGELK